MIYAKIFVEKDADGTDVIVFDFSAKDEVGYLRRVEKSRDRMEFAFCSAPSFMAMSISP